jgi:hypothetical protein
MAQRWCGLPRGVDPRRRHGGALLHLSDDWPDEPIAPARHGFDPAVAAWGLAERPAQRCDLNRKIALLD